MKRQNNLGSKIFMVILVIFFYAPILYAMVFSFNSSKSLTHFSGFSLKWYDKMFNDREMMEALLYTVVIAVLATLVSTVFGTLTAIGLSKSKKALKMAVEQVNNLPIMNPDIVTAIGLLVLFATFHIKSGFMTVLLAHIMFCTPYVILSVMPRLRHLDPNLAEAAMDLGATPAYALIKVIVPQAMPGIISGALTAFTMSFDDFVITFFVQGNGVSNISIIVYTMSKRVNPSINALATLVIVIISAVLLLINILPQKISKQKQKVIAERL